MHTLKLTNSGTGVRLAKRVKLISQKLLRVENEIRFLQSSDNIDKAKTEFIIEMHKREIAAFLDERKYLVECIIGFFAGDTFPADFVMNTENIFFTDTSSKTIRANMAYCTDLFHKRVEALAAKKVAFVSGNSTVIITDSKMEYVYSFITGNPDNESISEVTLLIGMSILSLINSDEFADFLNKKNVALGKIISAFNNLLAAEKVLKKLLKNEEIDLEKNKT